MRRRSRWVAVIAASLALIVVVLDLHAVGDSLTAEDRQYLPRYLAGVTAPPDAGRRTYDQEIQFITETQRAVLRVAPVNEGLPFDQPRELRELVEAGRGLCYDRSRAIEKLLRYAHFDVRHIALYSTAATHSKLKSLMTPEVPSHAVSEVRTARGWLVVDSNDPWMSFDVAGAPVSMETVQAAAAGNAQPLWQKPLPNPIYSQPFTFVYGVYSRHGHFYPPYDFIPDVNYSELVENLW